MNDDIISHLVAMLPGRTLTSLVEAGCPDMTGALLLKEKLRLSQISVISDDALPADGADFRSVRYDDPALSTCSLARLHASVEYRAEFPDLLAALGEQTAVIISHADEDQFARLHYKMKTQGFRCVAQLNLDAHYLFIRHPHDCQHIVFNATADNFHFLEPVISLAAGESPVITRLSHAGLTKTRLAGTLKYCDTAWFEWGDSAIIAASHLPKYCRLVCRIHRYELYSKQFLRVNWENVDEVVFVSGAMKQRFINQLGDKCPATLVMTVISNISPVSAPAGRSAIKRHPLHIACVARFVGFKNLHLLLFIMQALVKRNPRYRLFIAGRVEDECQFDSFLQLIAYFKLSRHIVIEGALPAEKMADWYADKTYLLSASYSESQGMGILEAMQFGIKPVVFPATGGLLEYLPKKYLFHSVDDAVEQLLRPVSNPQSYILEAQSILNSQENALRYRALWQAPLKQHFFSVLIPTWNRQHYVINAVSSALSQHYEAYDVIVVDDGSDDETLATLRAAFDDPRLRIVEKPHSGAPDTRNAAIAAAQGSHIVWLDSDDLLHPNTLTCYNAILCRHPTASVISCAMETMGADKKFYGQRHTLPARLVGTLARHNVISNPACCVLRTLYADVGGYDRQFIRAHDYEFWSRVMDRAQVMAIPQCSVAYRIHSGNLTGIDKPVDRTYEYKIFNNMLAHFPLHDLFPEMDRQQAEGFVQQKRQWLKNICQLDKLLVVINAISMDSRTLTGLFTFLARQTDRKFEILLVADSALSFTQFPLIISQQFQPADIDRYIRNKYPSEYYRAVVLTAAPVEMNDAIARLKKAFLQSDVTIPDCFTLMTF